MENMYVRSQHDCDIIQNVFIHRGIIFTCQSFSQKEQIVL